MLFSYLLINCWTIKYNLLYTNSEIFKALFIFCVNTVTEIKTDFLSEQYLIEMEIKLALLYRNQIFILSSTALIVATHFSGGRYYTNLIPSVFQYWASINTIPHHY